MKKLEKFNLLLRIMCLSQIFDYSFWKNNINVISIFINVNLKANFIFKTSDKKKNKLN